MTRPLPGSARTRFVVLAAVVFCGAAVLATWPAVRHVSSAYLAEGRPDFGEAARGDHLQSSYRLWLFGHQLGRGELPWVDPYTFQPESGDDVALGGWPFGLLAWPFYALGGPVVGWNLFTLLALALAGAAACWWLRELELGRAAALVGGLAFALAPYRLNQSTGHMLGAVSLLLPVSLACFERALRSRPRWHVGAAAALASIPLSGQVHLALGAVPFFGLYALCRTRNRRHLGAAALTVAVAIAAGALVQRTVIAHSIAAGGRSFEELESYSAFTRDLVSRTAREGPEQFVFLGWLTLVIAAAGLVVLLVERRLGLALALGAGVLLPAAAALGAHLRLYRFAWEHVDMLRYARVPERALPIACLCLGALVAFVAEWLAGRPRGGLLVAVLACLVIVDLHVRVFHPAFADRGNEAYAVLRGEGAGRLLELPVLRPIDSRGSTYLAYELEAQRQRPLGYSTVARPRVDAVARRLWLLNCGVVGPDARSLLAGLGVRYVALHSGVYEAAGHLSVVGSARAGLREAGFRRMASAGRVELWRLTGAPRQTAVRPSAECRDWHHKIVH